MKLHISYEIDASKLDSLKAFLLDAPAPKAKKTGKIPSAKPSRVSKTESALVARKFFEGRIGMLTTLDQVGKAMKKAGYNPSTSAPICSALARAKIIRRPSRGVYILD